jgi:hypothetical protein
VSQNDPTVHALATIARIFDQPEAPAAGKRQAAEFKPVAAAIAATDRLFEAGPGPIAAIRFKWIARRARDYAQTRS